MARTIKKKPHWHYTMQELQVWITYHDDSQIADYGLVEDNVFRLFKGNDI